MRLRIIPLVALVLLGGLIGMQARGGDNDAPELVPKFRKESPDGESHPRNRSELGVFPISLATPLVTENVYDKRFSAFGALFLYRAPLRSLSSTATLGLETGLGILISRLDLNQPNTEFTHAYLYVPATLTVGFEGSGKLSGGILAGAALRPLKYDSRSTADGGVRTPDETWLLLDAGGWIEFALKPTLAVYLRASTLFLATGVAIRW